MNYLDKIKNNTISKDMAYDNVNTSNMDSYISELNIELRDILKNNDIVNGLGKLDEVKYCRASEIFGIIAMLTHNVYGCKKMIDTLNSISWELLRNSNK